MRGLGGRLLPILGIAVAGGLFIFLLRWPGPVDAPWIPVSGVLKQSMAPLTGALTWTVGRVQGSIEALLSLGRIRAENEQLKRQVAELQAQIVQMEEYRQENLRLKQLLAYKAATSGDWQLKVAPVVARSPSNWFSTLTIGLGSDDGIGEDQVVLTPAGVVGRIIRVFPKTAEVLLLLDREGAVGAMVQSSRVLGVVEASSDYRGYLQMIHLAHDAPVKENDIVLTSGLGGIFPKGLPIGRVVKILPEPDGLMKRAIIEPYADFDRLEEVLVITKILRVQEDASSGVHHYRRP
ncbi:MAG: rod shape-determining protein MreC [Thermanaeromonas sp.]|uniref:rod shape-determining protein MreC n=1 Tax=Thermanaeromonas sp. TaxID=2003697 RepID=UPI00243C05C5|nr:rod shape-determining protein MreC [Thermanaeromonas sp.]MCG0278155.1 rod shape-determining protein MreC [Thermanaeromonas sp.]